MDKSAITIAILIVIMAAVKTYADMLKLAKGGTV